MKINILCGFVHYSAILGLFQQPPGGSFPDDWPVSIGALLDKRAGRQLFVAPPESFETATAYRPSTDALHLLIDSELLDATGLSKPGEGCCPGCWTRSPLSSIAPDQGHAADHGA